MSNLIVWVIFPSPPALLWESLRLFLVLFSCFATYKIRERSCLLPPRYCPNQTQCDAGKKIAYAFLILRLDYCHLLSIGCPPALKVHSCAAMVGTGMLPVKSRFYLGVVPTGQILSYCKHSLNYFTLTYHNILLWMCLWFHKFQRVEWEANPLVIMPILMIIKYLD